MSEAPSKEQSTIDDGRAPEGMGQPKGATAGVTPVTSGASLTSKYVLFLPTEPLERPGDYLHPIAHLSEDRTIVNLSHWRAWLNVADARMLRDWLTTCLPDETKAPHCIHCHCDEAAKGMVDRGDFNRFRNAVLQIAHDEHSDAYETCEDGQDDYWRVVNIARSAASGKDPGSPEEPSGNPAMSSSTNLFGTSGTCTCGFADVPPELPCKVHSQQVKAAAPLGNRERDAYEAELKRLRERLAENGKAPHE